MKIVNGLPVLTGGPEWDGVLEVIVEGDDLVAHNVRATWFAGGIDRDDNSIGHVHGVEFDTSDPDLLGCALPFADACGCKTPPIPMGLPGGSIVHVYCSQTGGECDVTLVDTGPSAPGVAHAHAGIDLTRGAWYAMGADPDGADITVDFRIAGGARHLDDDTKSAIAALSALSEPERHARHTGYSDHLAQPLGALYTWLPSVLPGDAGQPALAALNAFNEALLKAGCK